MDSELFWNESKGSIASIKGGTASSRAVFCAAIALAAQADVVYFPYDVHATWTHAKSPRRVLVIDVDDDDRAPGRNRRRPPPNALLVTRFANNGAYACDVRIDIEQDIVSALDIVSNQLYLFSTAGQPRAPA